jgi:hypothetical protein
MNRLTESVAVIGTIDPASLSVGAHNSDVIDMSKFERVAFVLLTGTLGASATVDLAVKYDTASGGSFANTLAGKTIAQMVKATDDNKQAVIEVKADELPEGARYLRGTITVGTAASQAALVVLGGDAKYGPAKDHDLSSVAQIVV